jgi:pyridoxal phosphate-dependent aminotransferase EpsN
LTERIYLSPPHLTGHEQKLVAEAFASNWIAPFGPQLDAFEAELADRVGVQGALATSSGTAALHLVLAALGVSSGDVVVGATFTFIGSVNPVRYLGAEPWFVDADPATWCLDPALLEEALAAASAEGRKVGAVVAVDLFGQCADYGEIEEICHRFGVPVVEDAAEALGATFGDRAAGSYGTAGILSFNGNKIVTTSGGGAVVSDDPELLERARFLANQARDPAVHYEHSKIGYNYRLSNLLAAVGLGQLATLDDRVAARRRVFDTYAEALGDVDGIAFMPEASYGRSNRWLTTLTIDPVRFGATRNDVIDALEKGNVEARPVWKPMHQQPVYAGSRNFGGAVSERLFADGLCLPSGTDLSDDQVRHISALVRDVGGG